MVEYRQEGHLRHQECPSLQGGLPWPGAHPTGVQRYLVLRRREEALPIAAQRRLVLRHRPVVEDCFLYPSLVLFLTTPHFAGVVVF